MDVCIKLKDPELVGEFLQALRILCCPDTHPSMQKGYHYLLTCEKSGKMRGNWVPATAPFYQRYHAAYCGIIGLADFKFNKERSEKERGREGEEIRTNREIDKNERLLFFICLYTIYVSYLYLLTYLLFSTLFFFLCLSLSFCPSILLYIFFSSFFQTLDGRMDTSFWSDSRQRSWWIIKPLSIHFISYSNHLSYFISQWMRWFTYSHLYSFDFITSCLCYSSTHLQSYSLFCIITRCVLLCSCDVYVFFFFVF